MNKYETDDKINRFFHSIKDVLGDKYVELSSEYDLSRPGFKLSSLPIGALFDVFNKLNVTLDSIIQNSVDLDSLYHQFQGKDYLPIRYTGNVAYSSRFTSIYMIDFLEKLLGKKSVNLILQNLQLLPSHFKNRDEKNNIRLPLDICNYVYKYYGTEVVEKMGESSLMLLKGTEVGQQLNKSNDLTEMMELFFTDLAPLKIEKNYVWSLSEINSNYVIVSGRPNQEVEYYLGKDKIVSLPLESLRMGFLNSLPKLHGDYSTSTRTLKSMAFGDDCDLYKIEYTPLPRVYPTDKSDLRSNLTALKIL
jgi:hypothetical protein